MSTRLQEKWKWLAQWRTINRYFDDKKEFEKNIQSKIDNSVKKFEDKTIETIQKEP